MAAAWTPERRAAQAERIRNMPPEARRKAAAKQAGRVMSDEQRKKLSAVWTPERRRKLAEAITKRPPQAAKRPPPSIEQRRARSAAMALKTIKRLQAQREPPPPQGATGDAEAPANDAPPEAHP